MPLNHDLQRRLASAERAVNPVNPEHVRIAREAEACYGAMMPEAVLDRATLPPMTVPLERARACYDRLMAWIRDGMPGSESE